MIDLGPIFRKEITLKALCSNMTIDDLRTQTNQMIDTYLEIIAACTDADVVFEPEDLAAQDDATATDDETNIAWTLGHVIVHTTAGSEEGAFTAAELARGVEFHGRSHYEVPWQTVTTINQVKGRLEESRRIRLATLDVWPDKPHLENTVELSFLGEAANGIGCFVVALGHESAHIEQTKEIVRQAKA